jgi:hypothetical protein
MLVRQHSTLPGDEPNLNRKLRRTTTTACRELDPEGRFGYPTWEAQSPPDPDADTVQPHELNRPDVQWGYDDPVALDDPYGEKYFTVECKRLGRPVETGWCPNEYYVTRGIERFRSLGHKYGLHMSEGAMIGWLQSMRLPDVHADVCRYAVANHMPPPVVASSGWQPCGVTELTQRLERDFPLSPFDLTHLWCDIQDIRVTVPTPAAPPRPDRQLGLFDDNDLPEPRRRGGRTRSAKTSPSRPSPTLPARAAVRKVREQKPSRGCA